MAKTKRGASGVTNEESQALAAVTSPGSAKKKAKTTPNCMRIVAQSHPLLLTAISSDKGAIIRIDAGGYPAGTRIKLAHLEALPTEKQMKEVIDELLKHFPNLGRSRDAPHNVASLDALGLTAEDVRLYGAFRSDTQAQVHARYSAAIAGTCMAADEVAISPVERAVVPLAEAGDDHERAFVLCMQQAAEGKDLCPAHAAREDGTASDDEEGGAGAATAKGSDGGGDGEDEEAADATERVSHDSLESPPLYRVQLVWGTQLLMPTAAELFKLLRRPLGSTGIIVTETAGDSGSASNVEHVCVETDSSGFAWLRAATPEELRSYAEAQRALQAMSPNGTMTPRVLAKQASPSGGNSSSSGQGSLITGMTGTLSSATFRSVRARVGTGMGEVVKNDMTKADALLFPSTKGEGAVVTHGAVWCQAEPKQSYEAAVLLDSCKGSSGGLIATEATLADVILISALPAHVDGRGLLLPPGMTFEEAYPKLDGLVARKINGEGPGGTAQLVGLKVSSLVASLPAKTPIIASAAIGALDLSRLAQVPRELKVVGGLRIATTYEEAERCLRPLLSPCQSKSTNELEELMASSSSSSAISALTGAGGGGGAGTWLMRFWTQPIANGGTDAAPEHMARSWTLNLLHRIFELLAERLLAQLEKMGDNSEGRKAPWEAAINHFVARWQELSESGKLPLSPIETPDLTLVPLPRLLDAPSRKKASAGAGGGAAASEPSGAGSSAVRPGPGVTAGPVDDDRIKVKLVVHPTTGLKGEMWWTPVAGAHNLFTRRHHVIKFLAFVDKHGIKVDKTAGLIADMTHAPIYQLIYPMKLDKGCDYHGWWCNDHVTAKCHVYQSVVGKPEVEAREAAKKDKKDKKRDKEER